jgi:hypothetical protein
MMAGTRHVSEADGQTWATTTDHEWRPTYIIQYKAGAAETTATMLFPWVNSDVERAARSHR